MNCLNQSATDSIVLINKGSGVTSFACLNYVKRNVNRKTGHCGTLDKFATGLIIACCGSYTKKVPLFMGMDKTYVATIEFGRETDTLDPEGETVKTGEIPSFKVIEKAVAQMTGDIIQVPPVYSALHVNGQRSYSLVRKGREVKLEGRPVTIKNARIIRYEKPYLEIELEVSKGTYIRSYARDLGQACGSCAYVTELKRTKIGPFDLSDAILWNDEDSLRKIDESNAYEILGKLNK